MTNMTKRRLLLVLLIFLMAVPSVSSADIPLPVSLLAGRDSGQMRIVLYEPEIKKLAQFDDSRTDQLNRLIRHFAVDINLDRNVSDTAIMIDSKTVFSFLEKEENGLIQRIYSFEPDAVFSERQNDESQDADSFASFLEKDLLRGNQYLDDFHDFFASIPDAFPDRVRNDKTELHFSGFGRAVKRITVSFPADYVAEYFPKALADIADSEECRTIVSGLTFSGAQKVTLLYDENDRIVRINYDGNIGETQETLRKVALVWKCLRETEHQKDSVSLKTPSVKGADKDNIAFERELEYADPEAGKYIWDMQIDHKAGKEDKKQVRFTAELTDNHQSISGKVEYTVKRDGNNTKIRIIPEISQESSRQYKGTLEIADYSGKIEKDRVIVKVKLDDSGSLNWKGDGLKEGNMVQSEDNNLLQDPNETIAAIMIRELFELPEEDLKYFSKGIPDDIWLELIH